MARLSRILALDIGASSIKAAEFEYPAGGALMTLAAFDYREYGEELSEENRSVLIATTLREMLSGGRFTARKAVLAISGQFALIRFVKLPPVAEEESRVRQIVEFEARQNVPFPMDEVIWDYQLIANPEASELEVMFVVIKSEIVEQITTAVQACGLQPILVDVAPCAGYNAARACSIGDEDCAMVLSLGDRSTNLLFADRQQFFARTIPIAGHSITQQIAKEFGITMAKAEELKRRHGFVALGGAYAEPDSEVAAAVSKIVRNVMTRLHGEVNRSIGVYRSQQKGNVPRRLYLTGGSSIMGYTDKFFADKMGIPVDYFNPFQMVQLRDDVDRERLQEVAHMFSEVVGLGLRCRGACPVEVSLMPDRIVRQLAMRQKTPYVFACAACVLVTLGAVLLAAQQKERIYAARYNNMKDYTGKLEALQKQIQARLRETGKIMEEHRTIEVFIGSREEWPRLLGVIESQLPEGLWLTSLKPIGSVAAVASGTGTGPGGAGQGMGPGGWMPGPGGPGGPPGGGFLSTVTSGKSAQSEALKLDTVEIAGLILQGHSLQIPADAIQVRAPAAPAEGGGDAPVAVPGPEGEPAEKIEPKAPPTGEVPPAAAVPPAEEAPAIAKAPPATLQAPAAVPAPAAGRAAPAVPRGRSQSPEEILLSRLQATDFVDPDPSKTRITSYRSNEQAGNLKNFTLQIVFKQPIKLTY